MQEYIMIYNILVHRYASLPVIDESTLEFSFAHTLTGWLPETLPLQYALLFC